MPRVNVYAGGTLDRVARRRGDAAWLAERRTDPESRYVALWRGLCLVDGEDPPRAVLLAPVALDGLLSDEATVVLLGETNGAARFAVDLAAPAADPTEGPLAGCGAFRDLRGFGGLMPPDEAALLAYARGLTRWHARHRFCGVCGAPTGSRQAGHLRLCSDPACAATHFPRTDPAVIMVVSDGERCLLGRQKDWPPGLYSALAGFVEPGESLEEAVAREVMEETGIAVEDVRYHSSQPWPFPASLMLGFHARAATTRIDIARDELEDARWFHRDALVRPAEGFRLPRPDSIARRLVEDWISGKAGS
ncbi:MAG: NAD(+) diphosphatase [Alphaproteobacteria bacterium]